MVYEQGDLSLFYDNANLGSLNEPNFVGGGFQNNQNLAQQSSNADWLAQASGVFSTAAQAGTAFYLSKQKSKQLSDKYDAETYSANVALQSARLSAGSSANLAGTLLTGTLVLGGAFLVSKLI